MTTDSREHLIAAAKKVFALKGYDGATVKDLAEEAQLNVSLISYYFEGKEGLFRACLESFGTTRNQSAERILQPPKNLQEFEIRLKMFLTEFIEHHINEPHITAILHRDFCNNMPLMKDIFRNNFYKLFENLLAFFEHAKQNQILRSDLDVFVSAGLFFSGIVHSLRLDDTIKEITGKTMTQSTYRDQVINEAIKNLLNGIKFGASS